MNELELLKIAAQYACTSIKISADRDNSVPRSNDDYIKITKTFYDLIHKEFAKIIHKQEHESSAQ